MAFWSLGVSPKKRRAGSPIWDELEDELDGKVSCSHRVTTWLSGLNPPLSPSALSNGDSHTEVLFPPKQVNS